MQRGQREREREREREGKLASEWTHRDMETDHGERKMTETHNREQNKVGYCRIRETKRNGTGGQDHRRGRASSEERESDERTSERTRNSGHSSLRRNPYS